MEVVVASHPSALEHNTTPFHPERPARVGAVAQGIADSGLVVVEIESPEIRRSELALVHDPSYIEMIESFCRMGGGLLDRDTFASEESWVAALTAAGGVSAAIEELEDRSDATAFVIARPPGHHALRSRAMGFCLFNNVAVGAALLRSQGHRVAILDWDVHHGNGTQAMVIEDPGILYVSVHQDAFYPFQGDVGDIEREAKGTTINVPVPAGTAGDLYRRAWGEIVIPVVRGFEPDWVLVSCGFDAHVSDRMAELRLVASDYGWMAAQLAATHPAYRTVFALEGGYDLEALRDSTAETLRGVSGQDQFGEGLVSPWEAQDVLDPVFEGVSRHWAV
ncbi:MAG TPA: histone deacetylase [Acidimicrobiia bacterium]|nr:histone deacetylase [Acidimicrobiia bacterium]